jgi:hypothetical protein
MASTAKVPKCGSTPGCGWTPDAQLGIIAPHGVATLMVLLIDHTVGLWALPESRIGAIAVLHMWRPGRVKNSASALVVNEAGIIQEEFAAVCLADFERQRVHGIVVIPMRIVGRE